MSRVVVKRDGGEQSFDRSKIDRWAQYGDKHTNLWKHLADSTVERLPMRVTSEEIHHTMIKVCLAEEDIQASRFAARLELATVRKDMANKLYCDIDAPFEIIYDSLLMYGIWCSKTMPTFDSVFEHWYDELKETRFEYWQVKQWNDKYGIRHEGASIETPVIGALGIAIALYGQTEDALILAKEIVSGRINLPTPVLNGCRNGDFDSISCCVISGGDSVDSIGVAEHLAYKMTAKKAGIGIEMRTRSVGDSVKNGRIAHLGKTPIYAAIDKSVKMFTQVSRGGSATVTFSVYDPEVIDLIHLKSQRTVENKRIDKLDYSMSYDWHFVKSVIANTDIQTISVDGTLGPVIPARKILFAFLTIRQETGRMYCFNIEEANSHTPFRDEIFLSNLCQEISLPTKPFIDMSDLYGRRRSKGEVAFCSLAAINIAKIDFDEDYERTAYIAVKTVDLLISKVEMISKSTTYNLNRRRSLGIGITGLAGGLAIRGLTYADSREIERIAERHYYFCLKASQRLVEEGLASVSEKDIDINWLPIDTKRTETRPTYNWEALRGKPRRNSVLVAHMPTESSAVFSDATNGLYPIRDKIIEKQSRHGIVQYIAPAAIKEIAWDIDNTTLAKMYGAVQAYTDQSISADYYVVPSRFPNGKVPMSTLMKEWVVQAKLGVKSMYYSNTNDDNGGTFADEGCEGGCKL